MSAQPPAGSKKARREERLQRREAERQRQIAAARRSKWQPYLIGGILVAVVAAVIVFAGGPIGRTLSPSTAAAQGQQTANDGREHIELGQAHAPYTSNPPTSGPHYTSALPWGVYDTPQADEYLVHNLEHGGIVINYNCPDGCPELVQQLTTLAREYRSKVILAPRPNDAVPHRITLTAWTWLDGFDDFDADRIRAFITAHKDKGPEFFAD